MISAGSRPDRLVARLEDEPRLAAEAHRSLPLLACAAAALSVATSIRRMPALGGAWNSCDSRCSPSTSVEAFTVAPAVIPLNCARPASSVFDGRRLAVDGELNRMAGDVVGERAANEANGDRSRPADRRPAAGCRTSASCRASGTARPPASPRHAARTRASRNAQRAQRTRVRPSELRSARLAEPRVGVVRRPAARAQMLRGSVRGRRRRQVPQAASRDPARSAAR